MSFWGACGGPFVGWLVMEMNRMRDLEMTRLCAEAMGIDTSKGYLSAGMCPHCEEYGLDYDPLHDDTQAMALVKKHGLMIVQHPSGNWHVSSHVPFSFPSTATDKDLNRAIVECVAKMQASK